MEWSAELHQFPTDDTRSSFNKRWGHTVCEALVMQKPGVLCDQGYLLQYLTILLVIGKYKTDWL